MITETTLDAECLIKDFNRHNKHLLIETCAIGKTHGGPGRMANAIRISRDGKAPFSVPYSPGRTGSTGSAEPRHVGAGGVGTEILHLSRCLLALIHSGCQLADRSKIARADEGEDTGNGFQRDVGCAFYLNFRRRICPRKTRGESAKQFMFEIVWYSWHRPRQDSHTKSKRKRRERWKSAGPDSRRHLSRADAVKRLDQKPKGPTNG